MTGSRSKRDLVFYLDAFCISYVLVNLIACVGFYFKKLLNNDFLSFESCVYAISLQHMEQTR